MKRIVVTGGPGAGKTASVETARRSIAAHVGFAPESASIVFGGGFPRDARATAACAAQRAIFHVQRELESIYDDRSDLVAVICDRGTLDGAAYWPTATDEFFQQLEIDREVELARYTAVIHLRPPPSGDGYERLGLRVETAEEAARIDARIEEAWRGHPRRFFVEHSHDFVAKVASVIALLETEIR